MESDEVRHGGSRGDMKGCKWQSYMYSIQTDKGNRFDERSMHVEVSREDNALKKIGFNVDRRFDPQKIKLS